MKVSRCRKCYRLVSLRMGRIGCAERASVAITHVALLIEEAHAAENHVMTPALRFERRVLHSPPVDRSLNSYLSPLMSGVFSNP